MYIYIYIYKCTSIYIYINMCIYIYSFKCIYIYLYVFGINSKLEVKFPTYRQMQQQWCEQSEKRRSRKRKRQ